MKGPKGTFYETIMNWVPSQGEQIAEFRIGAVIHTPIGFDSQKLAVVVCGKAYVDKKRGTLAAVSYLLIMPVKG
jgi:hypothetical protein